MSDDRIRRIADKLLCNGNDPGVTDFGAPNDVGRKTTGEVKESRKAA